jgi:hypothetical protein
MGWGLRSLWPLSDALGARPVSSGTWRRWRTAGPAHGGDQGGAADLGQAGQAAGQGGWVDPAVAGLSPGGVGGQLGLGGAQQPDLGGDLGGQVLEGDGGVVAVQLDRGLGDLEPLGGAGRAEVVVGGFGDQPGQPGLPGGQERVGVGVAFQLGQVGLAELADQWAHRRELTDQVFAAPLVGGGGLGEPVGGAHAPVQCRPFRAGQLQRPQPGRVDQGQPSQVWGRWPFVMLDIDPEDLLQVAAADDPEPVQALGSLRIVGSWVVVGAG